MTRAVTPGPQRRSRGGALLLLSVLLIGSAALRLAITAGPAISRGIAEHAGETMDTPEATDIVRGTDPDFQHLLEIFQEREAALRSREALVEDRMKALDVADAAIERKMAALLAAEEALSETVAMADGAAEKDLARLTTLYEKMKPKDAAVLFEEMDPRFAAGFLGRMNPEAAAGIMAGLSPPVAYTVSVVLAGRNANVPTE